MKSRKASSRRFSWSFDGWLTRFVLVLFHWSIVPFRWWRAPWGLPSRKISIWNWSVKCHGQPFVTSFPLGCLKQPIFWREFRLRHGLGLAACRFKISSCRWRWAVVAMRLLSRPSFISACWRPTRMRCLVRVGGRQERLKRSLMKTRPKGARSCPLPPCFRSQAITMSFAIGWRQPGLIRTWM